MILSMKFSPPKPSQLISSDSIIKHVPAFNGNCQVFHVVMPVLSVSNLDMIHKNTRKDFIVLMHIVGLTKTRFFPQLSMLQLVFPSLRFMEIHTAFIYLFSFLPLSVVSPGDPKLRGFVA